jgi:membrane protein YqaA with SNARE-associated domain
MPLAAIILIAAKKSALRWLINLGGPGLILLGLADNSIVPMPGSTDVVTILLVAHHREMWWYYVLMATAGAMLGGFVTYRMARKGGKETLERKVSRKKVKKIYGTFERWGFGSVAISAILPPPFPIVPVLLAAGAMQYPTRKFLTALALGRGARFLILAYLGAHYGVQIVSFASRYYWHVLITLIALSVFAGLYGWWQYKHIETTNTSRPDLASTPTSVRQLE